jgi:hypothetical protein
MLDPAFEESGERHTRRLDMGALIQFGDQTGAFDLGLPLGALEGIPALLASAAGRIGYVDHDGPMTGRTLA